MSQTAVERQSERQSPDRELPMAPWTVMRAGDRSMLVLRIALGKNPCDIE